VPTPKRSDGKRIMLANMDIGDELDSKYRVIRRLGFGGFGIVYLAEDELAGRQVAIKHLRDPDPDRQSDLVHEMRSLDQLHHPGVVGFYHHFFSAGSLFLVMEYCAGGNLRRRAQDQPAPAHTIMQWGRELAETLGMVHQRGIVHHDIKPDNILFTGEALLKIGDFGVANRNIGTDVYISPEMHRGEADLNDVRVDIYALAITLLELLLRQNPFLNLSRVEMLRAKVNHDFIPGGMERWLQEILSKATHPSPELRFQSMDEFREAIDAKHVTYIFDRGRIQAHSLAAQAEKHLARKQVSAASKCVTQALYAGPDCVSAVVAAGRYNLFINRVVEAGAYLDRALKLNPRVDVQKELGWLCLESGNYSRAISLLTDRLQRSGDDYEAFNLLLECFYRTGRYEAGMQVAKLMVEAKAPSDCFVNNGLLCGRLLDSTEELLVRVAGNFDRPFVAYNAEIFTQPHDRKESLLLFENYRFGLASLKPNTLTIEQHGVVLEFYKPLITVGRVEQNQVRVEDNLVSRRHCAIVNYRNDVWIYDLGSTCGVFVDGSRIDRKAYLDGVHVVRIGKTELKVCSTAGLLV
jgi:tRNA A-37 threonylcarbamoyl transferase component Bud32